MITSKQGTITSMNPITGEGTITIEGELYFLDYIMLGMNRNKNKGPNLVDRTRLRHIEGLPCDVEIHYGLIMKVTI